MDHFDGTQRAWRDWAVVTKSYAGVMNPKLVELMTAAEQTSAYPEVRNAILPDDAARAASQQLYTLLLHACKGPSLNKIVNAGQGEGTVAWRALVARYDPNALAVRAGTLQNLLSWSFSVDVLERIEAWEREVAHYEALSGSMVPEDLRIGIVLRQMDESPVKNHMILNAERFKLWKDFMAEITSVRLAMNATAGGQAPMDLGAVGPQGPFQLLEVWQARAYIGHLLGWRRR